MVKPSASLCAAHLHPKQMLIMSICCCCCCWEITHLSHVKSEQIHCFRLASKYLHNNMKVEALTQRIAHYTLILKITTDYNLSLLDECWLMFICLGCFWIESLTVSFIYPRMLQVLHILSIFTAKYVHKTYLCKVVSSPRLRKHYDAGKIHHIFSTLTKHDHKIWPQTQINPPNIHIIFLRWVFMWLSAFITPPLKVRFIVTSLLSWSLPPCFLQLSF